MLGFSWIADTVKKRNLHLTPNQPKQNSVSVNSLVVSLSGSDPTPSPASPLYSHPTHHQAAIN
jgi:hypothetical protein